MAEDVSPSACEACPSHHAGNLIKLGVDMENWDYVVALAGNPNTGKSTVFNSLTGLRQHTGNWPGKTVVRAEGGFESGGKRYKLVDLPGTYSLLSTSCDEEVARDFILFGRPDVTVVVVDATRLERNLNLVLQGLELLGLLLLLLLLYLLWLLLLSVYMCLSYLVPLHFFLYEAPLTQLQSLLVSCLASLFLFYEHLSLLTQFCIF